VLPSVNLHVGSAPLRPDAPHGCAPVAVQALSDTDA
jgi:hypothetical protein